MAYVPIEFTNGTRTEVANNPTEEATLRWDGWLPTEDYVPPPPREVRTVADVFNTIGGAVVYAGTNAATPRPQLPAGVKATWYCTEVPTAMLDGDVHVKITAIA